MKLPDYREELAQKGASILKSLHIVYFAMEMRTGKTTTSLRACELRDKKNVLFVTKKKAIKSIEKDYTDLKLPFKIKIINYEQLEKEKPEYDCYIIDEAHSCSGYPKASVRTKALKLLIKQTDMILLSGTPSPETYGSQLFHQFYLSYYNPFNIDNFYKWAKMYVDVKERIINGQKFNDYSDAKKEEIMKVVEKYFITYTQEQAGFENNIVETVHNVDIDPRIFILINILQKNKIYQFKDSEELIICDTAVKLQNKIHQLCSGTIITENKEFKILDKSKANFIKKRFEGRKIAIFYKFQAEGMALKETFANWTDKPEEFNQSEDKVFICQVQSGSMGTNLSTANDLIFYNIDFSALQYWQARARLSHKDRKEPCYVHWVFSNGGIEHKIYQSVLKKRNYTTLYFKKDYGIGKRDSEQSNSLFKVGA